MTPPPSRELAASADQRLDDRLGHEAGRLWMRAQPVLLFDLKSPVLAQAVDGILWRESGMGVAALGRDEDLEGGVERQLTPDQFRHVVPSAEVELPTDDHVQGSVVSR